MQKIIPNTLETREAYQLLVSCIGPRPIAFVSTINKNGVPNAAPFCFFMPVTPSPPIIALSIIRRGDTKKDTIRNIEHTRDFVVNVVDETLVTAMNTASGSYPPDMSEFDLAGIRPVPGEIVKSPRISESPIQLECKLHSIVELGEVPASLVLGEIVCIHVKDSYMKDGTVDPTKLKPVGRLGENLYVRFSDFFELHRPA